MSSDLDIYRTAKLLIDKHGGHEALQAAGGQVLKMAAVGDAEGEAVWCRIVDAVQELRRTVPRPGERRH